MKIGPIVFKLLELHFIDLVKCRAYLVVFISKAVSLPLKNLGKIKYIALNTYEVNLSKRTS